MKTNIETQRTQRIAELKKGGKYKNLLSPCILCVLRASAVKFFTVLRKERGFIL